MAKTVIMVYLLTYEQAISIQGKDIPGTEFKFSCQWDADMNLILFKDYALLVDPADPIYGWLYACPMIPWKRIQPGTVASASFSVPPAM